MECKYFPAEAAQNLLGAISRSLSSCRTDYEHLLRTTAAFGSQPGEVEKQWFPDTRDAKQASQYFFGVTYRLLKLMSEYNWITGSVWQIEGCKGDFCKKELQEAFPKAHVESKENLVDVSLVIDEHAKDVWFAAELEIDKQPGDGAEDRRHEDFRKLLNCTAAVKLFVCRSQEKDASPRCICDALTTLSSHHSSRMRERGVSLPGLFAVIVVPTEAKRYAQAIVRVIATNEAGETEMREAMPFEYLQLATVGRGRPPISRADVASLNKRIAGSLNQEWT